jgi:uncharacterized lipoprotein YehR (DUF1307 family)
MKNLIPVLITLCFLLTSCETKKKTEKFSVDAANSKIVWTAYKTTDKFPVEGQFTDVAVEKSTGENILNAIDGTEFNIPVSSIFTNNADRDQKISTFFFGVLVESMNLKGSLHIEEEGQAYAMISLNGLSEKLPMTYNVKGNTVSLNGTMDLNKWNAIPGVESINEACYELHKGADGISKTWDEVAIALSIPVLASK